MQTSVSGLRNEVTMKKITFAFLALALLSAVQFCKPSSENEKNKHAVLVKDANSYMTSFPKFKTHVEDLLKKSEAAFAEASKLTDDAQKAEKMKAANEILSDSKLISQLGSYVFKEDDIQDDIKLLTENKTKVKFHDEINSAVSLAIKNLGEAKSIMDNAKAGTVEEATEEVTKAVGLLIDANSKLDKVSAQIKKDKKKDRKK